MNERPKWKFLAFFTSAGFLMKMVGEFIHEVLGHGLFVTIFGGRILHVYISPIWPYEPSHIRYSPPSGGFEPWQRSLIDGGGIMVCLLVSFLIQAVLYLTRERRRINWAASTPLFWLSFWNLISSTGYLIMGGIKPFGDLVSLIEAGVLTRWSALTLGLIILSIGFYTLSLIFRDILTELDAVRDAGRLRVYLTALWSIIPVITGLNVIGYGHPPIYLTLGLMPPIAAYLIAPALWKEEPTEVGTQL